MKTWTQAMVIGYKWGDDGHRQHKSIEVVTIGGLSGTIPLPDTDFIKAITKKLEDGPVRVKITIEIL